MNQTHWEKNKFTNYWNIEKNDIANTLGKERKNQRISAASNAKECITMEHWSQRF